MLKERNINEIAASNKATNSLNNDTKESTLLDDVGRGKASTNAQQNLTVNETNTVTKMVGRQHQNENDDDNETINLDLDEMDDEQSNVKDECAKAMSNIDGEHSNENDISFDVDEPSDDLYISTNNSKVDNQNTRSDMNNKIVDKMDDSVAIESGDEEDESSKSNGPDDEMQTNLVNGANNKSNSNANIHSDEKLSAKSNKRKFLISSDDEQSPPAKV